MGAEAILAIFILFAWGFCFLGVYFIFSSLDGILLAGTLYAKTFFYYYFVCSVIMY